MTIQAWNLLLNVMVTVLVVGYGIWIKSIFAQQLSSKDAALDALKAALTSKDAEISRLKTEAAPAITQAYNTMKQHANEMTAETQKLQQRLEATKNQLKSTMDGAERSKRLLPSRLLLVKCEGVLDTLAAFDEQFSEWFAEQADTHGTELLNEALSRYFNAYDSRLNAVSEGQKKARGMLDQLDKETKQ